MSAPNRWDGLQDVKISAVNWRAAYNGSKSAPPDGLDVLGTSLIRHVRTSIGVREDGCLRLRFAGCGPLGKSGAMLMLSEATIAIRILETLGLPSNLCDPKLKGLLMSHHFNMEVMEDWLDVVFDENISRAWLRI